MYPQFESIQVRREFDETRYLLPSRSLGALRWIGLLPLFFGGIFLVFGAFWLWSQSRLVFASGPRQMQYMGILFFLFGIPLVLSGCALSLGGLGILLNRVRSEVALTRTRLLFRERFGVFRWTWSRELAAIEVMSIVEHDMKPTVTVAGGAPRAMPSSPGAASTLAGILVAGPTIRPLLVGAGYPGALLRDLARMLSRDAAAISPQLAQGGRGLFRIEETTAEVIGALREQKGTSPPDLPR